MAEMPTTWTDQSAREALRTLFDAAVRAADPRVMLAAHLPPRPTGRVLVLGMGKSAAVMAAAVEEAWPDLPLSGLVVTRYGHAVPTRRIEVVEASHPVPDESGARAAERMLALAADLGEGDLLLFLVSGGGSALVPLPAVGISLPDKQAVNRALLASGATIHEMNCVRRHLSAIKGGRLAVAAFPARVVTLAISDVPGDDPAVIASGPTVADASTFAEAREIVARYGIDLPASVARHLEAAAEETPKPGDPRLARTEFHMIATPAMALDAAAEAARALGLTPVLLGDALEGEAREVGAVLAGVALAAQEHGWPAPSPAVLLSGGETTVTVGATTPGRGGRNMECLLGSLTALEGAAGIWGLMADTDGIDGTEEAAGAILAPDSLARLQAAGIDAAAALAGHDSYSVFAALGDTVVTGPTLTNVNDFRALLIV